MLKNEHFLGSLPCRWARTPSGRIPAELSEHQTLATGQKLRIERPAIGIC